MHLLVYTGTVLVMLPLAVLAYGLIKSFIEDLILAFKVGDTLQQIMMSSLASVVAGTTLIVIGLLFGQGK